MRIRDPSGTVGMSCATAASDAPDETPTKIPSVRAGAEPTGHCEQHYAPEPEPVWQNLPPQVGEQVEEVAKKGGGKLKRALSRIFRW